MTDREAKTAYETNLTDDQWVAIEPLLQEAKPWGGRPIKVNLREVVNALLSMNRTGCQWRMIPHDVPKPGAIRYYFDKWTDNGTLVRINDIVRRRAREGLEREAESAIGVMDSKSVKTTEAGGDCGFDAAKKIKGRKRQILVDTNGFLLRTLVHAADISDTEGGAWLIRAYHDDFPR